MPSPFPRLVFCLFACFLISCGGGGSFSTNPPPANPAFTSTPVAFAVEATPYFYQLAATSPDASAISFSLITGPIGAALSGNVIAWTPTHDQSRIPNNFSVKATTAAGGSATQSWSVTPNGTVNLSAVETYWTPSGHLDTPLSWNSNLPFPAALVPQADGSFSRFLGSSNTDGTFSIPDVPAGHYWLQVSPGYSFWTATSDFDSGWDSLGRPVAVAPQASTTTFSYSISGIAPSTSPSLIGVTSDLSISLPPGVFSYPSTTNTTIDIGEIINSNIDWSVISSINIFQFEYIAVGNFTGFALGPARTLSNVSFANGAVNPVTATLSPSPSASVPLNIKGTAWANTASNVGPVPPVIASSEYLIFAQPYLENRLPRGAVSPLEALQLVLLEPASQLPPISGFSPGACHRTTGPASYSTFPVTQIDSPPIITDIDYGAISYGDPYPSLWPRLFEYCQVSTIGVPRPNSTLVDKFISTTSQVTALPTAPVTPLVTPVQNPTLNGASFFQSTTLNTTKVNISWTPPATGIPNGYYVSIHRLTTTSLPSSPVLYLTVGHFGTTQTSVDLPPLTPGDTFVFTITANIDGLASIERAPFRSKYPSAESGIVSATFTTVPGATFQ